MKKFLKEVKVMIIDWSKVPSGTYYECKRHSYTLKGTVQKKGNDVYLTHRNENTGTIFNELSINEKYMIKLNTSDITQSNVKDLKLSEKAPSTYKPGVYLPFIAGYRPQVIKGGVIFGCKTVKNSQILELVKHLKK